MGKYEIPNANIGALGDNAHAENFAQTHSGGKLSDPEDLLILSGELRKLIDEASRRVKTPQERAAVDDLRLAEASTRTGDKKAVLDKLKDAGVWALSIAREIGTEVAAKALAHTLSPG